MKAEQLIARLDKNNIGPYIEVPCSLLSPIIFELLKKRPRDVINPASEAVAMGVAAGNYLATGRIPAVLMQNSGLCNALNALTSLNQIYGIPVLLVIAWRGEPGTSDAPEHYVMGKKTKELLNVFDIPYFVLSEKRFRIEIDDAARKMIETGRPAALILRKGLVDKTLGAKVKSPARLSKTGAIDIIADKSRGKAVLITTNGFISREAFNSIRTGGFEKELPSFYMLGSMGHALPMGLGLVMELRRRKKVVVLDGDGGCMMHLGGMTSVSSGKTDNLVYIVLDDGVYASTGGQPTTAGSIDLATIARGCGYRNICGFKSGEKLKRGFSNILKQKGPTFVHVKVGDVGGTEKIRVSDVYTCEEIAKNFRKEVS